MKAVNVLMTNQEIAEIDRLIHQGYSKSRADLVRKATIEFCVRHSIGGIDCSTTDSVINAVDPG